MFIPCLALPGVVSSVVVRRRARAPRGDTLMSSGVYGGTFSLFASPSTTLIEVLARFGFGVGSGVWSWSQGAVTVIVEIEPSCWWPRFPRTELRSERVVCIVEDVGGNGELDGRAVVRNDVEVVWREQAS